MKPTTARFHMVMALIPVAMLTACLGSNAPTEKDLVPIVTQLLKANGGFSGWVPREVVISNLKCNQSGDVYGCSFDVDAVQSRRNFVNGKVEEKKVALKAQSGRFIKNGDVWTLTR